MKFLGLFIVLPLLISCAELTGYSPDWYDAIKQAQTEEERGAAHFIYSDFGALNGHALESSTLPWKLSVASILMSYQNRFENLEDEDGIAQLRDRLLKQELLDVGLVYPDKILNAPKKYSEVGGGELRGMFRGFIEGKQLGKTIRFEASGISCVACHSSRAYDANGNPTNNLLLGLPSSSFNPEAYVSKVYKGLRTIYDDRKQMYSYIQKLFPEMDDTEKESFRYALGVSKTARRLGANVIEKSVKDLVETIDRAVPVSNGAPGLTNGVSNLKLQFGLLPMDQFHSKEAGFTSIPSIFDRGFRSSLLYDGVYGRKGRPHFVPISASEIDDGQIFELASIVSFFTIPTAGNSVEAAERAIPFAYESLKYISSIDSPRFPGNLNIERLEKGSVIYENKCSSCHGNFDNSNPLKPRLVYFPNKPVSIEEIGTDPVRALAIDEEMITAISETKMSDNLSLAKENVYVSTILTGIWATAPYLHNGSVPSLWQLMNPNIRSKKFLVGGHRLNFSSVGIDFYLDSDFNPQYPADHEPKSIPQIYDTRELGKSNSGHEKEFVGLSFQEKLELLEYLKVL